MNLNDALSAHASWKVKFRTAIELKQQLEADVISKDNCCDFGKWLHGSAKTAHGHMPEYSTCLQQHAAFHVEAGHIAKAINAGRYDQASAMLAAGKPYDVASSGVGTAIVRLRKAANL
jgi:Chemoreceptor zinc-binding domain